MRINPLHHKHNRKLRVRQRGLFLRISPCALKGFILLEALIALLVLAVLGALFSQSFGRAATFYAHSRNCCAATVAARSHLEMAVRLSVPGWHADGRHSVQLVRVEVPAPEVKENGRPMQTMLPSVRFARAVASVARGFQDARPASLLTLIPKNSSVSL